MNTFAKQLLDGARPHLSTFVEAWKPTLDLIDQFDQTPQDSQWHAEGNVFIHTQKVLEAVYQLLDTEAKHLSREKQVSLILGAVLHDIAKPMVTKVKEIEGRPRIVAPRHEEKGCSYLAYRLLELDLPYRIIQRVLRLVCYHQKPKRLVKSNAPRQEYFQLARRVDVELVYYLAKADVLGRQSPDKQTQLDNVELFRLFCEEHGLWNKQDPYEEWKIFFNRELAHLTEDSRDAVLGYAIQDFEAGLIYTPEEAVARRYPYLKSFPNLLVMCGPSGSGKSLWIESHASDYHKISLDDLRDHHTKHYQEENSFIIGTAKEQLKEHLRHHEKVVWDATNLRKDFRSVVCQLGFNYHALVTLVVLHVPEKEIYEANQSRTDQVTRSVVTRQFDSLEWVDDTEAHRVAFVNQQTCLDFRGKCDALPSIFKY